MPFRLADIQMGNALSFCLNNVHWMDATTPPLRKNIHTLWEHVSSIMIGSPQPLPPPPPEPWWVKYWIPLAVSAVAIIGLIIWFVTGNKVTIQTNEGTVMSSAKEEQKEDSIDSSQELTQKPDEDSGENTAQSTRTADSPIELTDTWEQIIEAGNDGTYKEKYRIGDTKEIEIGSESITMKLVAIDEDDLADGSGKAHMTWVADELWKERYYMNDTDTNKGGWEKSEMRSYLRDVILPLMPKEVQDNIREVTKYSYSYGEGKSVKTEDTIWIPSEREVCLADYSDLVKEKEGAAYTEGFKDYLSRIRYRAGAYNASWWWLRSTCGFFYSSGFLRVHSDGSIFDDNASREGGVVVGFCL